ncbi:MAG TPA: bifunctional nuclease family protein [Gemmatimonadaceae bacterium]|nr:bifunctional nuclease family protein [Gemmatimonadaceae bacterium]
MVEVTVSRLGRDSSSNAYVLILRERGGNRLLPIWIGQPEAESIAMEINHIQRERPLTHDLCKSLIVGLGGTLRRVHITKVQKSTYFAELLIQLGNGDTRLIDARPSDSIAIALRLAAPIFADESLLSTLPGLELEDDEEESAEDEAIGESRRVSDAQSLSAEQLKAYLENLRPEDFGKFNL